MSTKEINTKKLKQTKIILTIIFLIAIIIIFGILIYDMRFALKEAIKTWSYAPLESKFLEYQEENMLLGFLVISLTQAMLILFMIPSEGIEVISTICFGKVIAFSACMIGVVLGNFIIYLLVRKIGKNIIYIFKKKHQETFNELEKSKRVSTSRLTVGISLLYFIPGIPYGLIAITAASTKIKMPRYLIITTICSIPAIILSVLFGSVVTEGNLFWVIFAIVLVLIATILSIVFKKQLINFFTNKETRGDIEYFRSNPGHFDKLLFKIAHKYFNNVTYKKYNVHVNLESIPKIEGPFILVHNHPSFLDFAWTYSPMYPKLAHSVMAMAYFYKSTVGRILHNHVGAFPKMLFEPDFSALKNIKKVIKDGGIITLAPEGRLSPHGAMETINHSTVKLLRNLQVPVVIAKINGAYLSKPKWAKYNKRGKIEVNYEILFTKEDLKDNDDEVLYQIMKDKLNYDDFQWQEEKQIKFTGKKMAEGLDGILYICPKCGKEFTLIAKNDKVFCSECGFEAKLDNLYRFTSNDNTNIKNIRDWFNYQKDVENKKINDVNYTLETEVELKMPHPEGKGLKKVGKGVTTLTLKGLTYKGSINYEEVSIFFPIETMPALPFGANENFENYANNTYYYFIPSVPKESVKWSIVEELIYNKYIKDNNIKVVR